MSVQVIMKDGRPEWAVIPYEQYEALLVAAGQAGVDQPVAPTPAVGAKVFAAAASAAPAGTFSVDTFASLQRASTKSLAALAKDAGISPAYLTQIAEGARVPSPAVIRGLAQALGVKADDLLA